MSRGRRGGKRKGEGKGKGKGKDENGDKDQVDVDLRGSGSHVGDGSMAYRDDSPNILRARGSSSSSSSSSSDYESYSSYGDDDEEKYQDSVLKVMCVSQEGDYSSPWQSSAADSCTGTGVYIGGGVVLSAAHVIANATFIQVQKTSDPEKAVAEVIAVSHECDLALLRLKGDEPKSSDTDDLNGGRGKGKGGRKNGNGDGKGKGKVNGKGEGEGEGEGEEKGKGEGKGKGNGKGNVKGKGKGKGKGKVVVDTNAAAAQLLEDNEGGVGEGGFFRARAPAFFSDVPAMQISGPDDLPGLRDKVCVVGFPIGGDEVSITEGITSRVELQSYTHSGRRLLAVTVDAAVNSGASGGPVFRDGVVIGIAVQGMSGEDAQNIGEIVPSPVIHHFLESVRRGADTHFPTLGFSWQNTEARAIRKVHGLEGKDNRGVLVASTQHGGPAEAAGLRAGDVLCAVDGIRIASNGTVRYRGHRTEFPVVIHQKFVGDRIILSVVRDSKRIELSATLGAPQYFAAMPEYDVEPRFVIFAGMVFQPLEYNFLDTWDDWRENAPRELVYLQKYGKITAAREEAVIYSSCLCHEINVGYEDYTSQVVEEVNGAKVRGLAHFVELVTAATGMVVITTSRGVSLAFDVQEEVSVRGAIMKTYRVTKPCSSELDASFSPSSKKGKIRK